MKEKRGVWDRRSDDRRQGERRAGDQRIGQQRERNRRADHCPTCQAVLTPAYYCRNCKVRVIKIRPDLGQSAEKR